MTGALQLCISVSTFKSTHNLLLKANWNPTLRSLPLTQLPHTAKFRYHESLFLGQNILCLTYSYL